MHTDIAALLNPLIDLDYQNFVRKLLPEQTVILGVRLPLLRKIAKRVVREDKECFLAKLSSDTFEEKMLYGLIVAFMAVPLAVKKKYIETFIQQIDNWSLCDSFCAALKLSSIEKRNLFPFVCSCLEHHDEYHVRMGVVMLLNHYIETEWIDLCLKKLEQVNHSGYYAQMAVAWAISVCFVKFPLQTNLFLVHNQLSKWTHNKALQKISESHRVSQFEKQRLKQYKR